MSMRYIIGLLVAVCCVTRALAYDDLVQPSVAFSATAVHEAGAFRETQTIHYAAGKLRIDRGNGLSSTILDLRTQTQYVLMANHTYLVLPMDDELFRRFIARATDMSGAEKVGKERIEGMETTKYEFGEDGALKAAGYYWLTNTGIMMRRVWDDGVLGHNVSHREFLTRLSLEKQPDELFMIPASYRPME